MAIFKHQRVGIALTATFISAAVFVRCSPIAPSVSKGSLYNQHGKVAENVVAPLPVEPLAAKPTLPASARIVKFETKLLGETSFYTLEFDSSNQKLVTLSENVLSERFDELRNAGKTEVEIKAGIPQKITVIFRMQDDAFLNTDDIASFDSNLDPLENGKWALHLSSKVSKALSEHVMKNLEAVTIVFDSPAALPELPVAIKDGPGLTAIQPETAEPQKPVEITTPVPSAPLPELQGPPEPTNRTPARVPVPMKPRH